MEEHVLPELERVEEAVGRDLPRFGRVGDELAVGSDVDEAAADVHRDPVHFIAGRGMKVEIRDLVAVGDPQRAAAFRFGGQRGPCHGHDEGEKEGGA